MSASIRNVCVGGGGVWFLVVFCGFACRCLYAYTLVCPSVFVVE